MQHVTFLNLRCGVSVQGTLEFSGGCLVPDQLARSRPPGDETGAYFQNINGIAIDAPPVPIDPNALQSVLFDSLETAHKIFSAIAAQFQTYVYLDIPVTCEYGGVRYVLYEHLFEEEEALRRTHFIGGGNHCSDLTFLNRSRGPRLILDFYREAQNESRPLDYRVLQLWRFFEGWFGKKDAALKDELCNLSIYTVPHGYSRTTHEQLWQTHRVYKRDINTFYSYQRCAIAHGGGAGARHAKKVILPRHVQSDGRMFIRFLDMLDIANYLLHRSKRGRY
jgi:hypothetical protein